MVRIVNSAAQFNRQSARDRYRRWLGYLGPASGVDGFARKSAHPHKGEAV